MVYPVGIIYTHGNVEHADNMLSSDDTYATLSRAVSTDEAPVVVVDFGRNIVGFPIFTFAGASSNSPGITVAFSETLKYLTDVSDFTRSYNVCHYDPTEV